MATLNVGAMAARLGLDPSEFLDKMKGVQGFNGFVSGEMARQWKKSGRDGQEGMRLIDEALGIHVARPVARIVSETFPALGKAMGAILPGVAFSALGFAILEFGEHVARKMEEAKRKQEEYNEAIRKGKEITEDAAASHAKTMDELGARMAKLQGNTTGEAIFKGRAADAEAVEKLAKYTDKVTESLRKQQTAAAALMPVWAALGRAWNAITTTITGSGPIEKLGAATEEFRNKAAELARQDEANHTRTAKKFIDEETAKAEAAYKAALAAAPDPRVKNPLPAGFPRAGGGAIPEARETPDVTAARKQQLDAMHEIQNEAKRQADEAATKAKVDAMEAGAAHTKELRSELEAVTRLVSASQALASSEELAAGATGKGSVASIQAAAAAEVQKKLQDFLAEADTKFFSNTQQKIAATKEFQAALEAATPSIRAAALAEQTFKSFAEYNRGIAEFNAHLKEHNAELDSQADGHSKVAAAQAKELAGLIPLQQKLAALQDLEKGKAAAPAIGPPTANQAGIATAQAELAAANANAGITSAKIQTGAFREEIEKIQDASASLAGAAVSPWAKIDAEVEKLTGDLLLTTDQVKQLRGALVAEQGVKISAEFEKLVEKIREARAESLALSSASPFAKLDAEALKIAHEFGLDAQQLELVKQGLIELQAVENVGKAFLNVDSLNAAGAKMSELRQQMEALRRASTTGKTDEGTALSADALKAVRLEMLNIQEEQSKIALQTGDIDAGILAWATNLQKVQSAGEMAFQGLTEATKGFEDNTVKSFFAILDEQRGGQLQLIHDLEKMWSDYFKGLASMALKQGMDHLLAPVGRALGNALGGGKSTDAQSGAKPTGVGGFLASLIPKKDTSGATLTSAGTLLHSAATALMSAAAALRASAASGVGGGAGGSGAASVFAGAANDQAGSMPFYAAGGDATPGSSFISGEAGAERVDLDHSGGAHITPLGFSSGGGEMHQHFDMRGSVVTEDLLRRTEAMAAIRASEGRMMGAIPAMQREISLRKR
jgi:hypothetical protein